MASKEWVQAKTGRADWRRMTDADIRDLLELEHTRPLLEFFPHQTARTDNGQWSKGDLHYHTFLLNWMFNRGEPGEITPPPLDWDDNPKAQPRENLRWRAIMNAILKSVNPLKPKWLENPAKSVTYHKMVTDRCRADIVFMFAGFVWAYDPREVIAGVATRPFIPWADQRKILHAIVHAVESESPAEDGNFPKGRDVGLSWLCAGASAHQWLFHDRSVLWTTWKAELCDNYKPDSVFGKIRMVLRSLPPYMMPAGWTTDNHNRFNKMFHLIKPVLVSKQPKLTYSPEGTSIDGQAISEGEAAVSTRYTMLFCDEAGLIDHKKPGTVESLMHRSRESSVKTFFLLGSPRSKAGYLTKQSRLAAKQKDVSPWERRIISIHTNFETDPRKNRDLHCSLLRPKFYSDEEEYWGILLDLYICQAGIPEQGIPGMGTAIPENLTPEQRLDWNLKKAAAQRKYISLLGRCEKLDPKRSPREIALPMSPWSLGKCKQLGRDKHGRIVILQDIYGFPGV